MSYYFSIIGTRDNPLFELTFGTSKLGGDGVARFRDEGKHMNQFIVHAALDMVEDAQWATKELYVYLPSTTMSQHEINATHRYLKRVDSFQNNHVHCFLTGGNVKFMLLMNPDPSSTTYSAYQTSPPSRPSTARQSTTMLAANPTSQATEEAVRQFMTEVSSFSAIQVCRSEDADMIIQVYEAWLKCIMNPFYRVNQVVTSPVFRSVVATAGKKYL